MRRSRTDRFPGGHRTVRARIDKFAGMRALAVLLAALGALWATESHAVAQPRSSLTAAEKAAALLAGYPHTLSAIEDNTIVFKDGTRLPFDDGRGDKDFATLLTEPDIKDMFAIPYPRGAPHNAPVENEDPGRIRNAAFFRKMYGDCSKGEVEKNLIDVAWLPKRSGARLRVTRINDVAGQLAAVSRELDELPSSFTRFLTPPAGAYNCRTIAGTDQASAHGFGIAVDIALAHAHYWRWAPRGPNGPIAYRNAIPPAIVAIFEKHGFIWGGRWHHYDTMHFEYRPEILAAAK
jgi:hypothetical protein